MIHPMRLVVSTLLATVTSLLSNASMAQPHPQPEAGGLHVIPVEADVWLRRMVGRFSFDGVILLDGGAGSGIKGKGDCVSVGTGPGVQCLLNVSWQDRYAMDFGNDPDYGDDPNSPIGMSAPVPGAVSYLDPAAILFGLDPGKASINHLLVDNKGLPEGGLGANKGNWATFRTRCVNQPGIVGGCERIFRIEARPDSPLIWMWIDVEMGPKGIAPPVSQITMTLRPVSQDEAEEDSVQP